MFTLRKAQRLRERYGTGKITRAQLDSQVAKVRENVRHWYRRLTRRKSAERLDR